MKQHKKTGTRFYTDVTATAQQNHDCLAQRAFNQCVSVQHAAEQYNFDTALGVFVGVRPNPMNHVDPPLDLFHRLHITMHCA